MCIGLMCAFKRSSGTQSDTAVCALGLTVAPTEEATALAAVSSPASTTLTMQPVRSYLRTSLPYINSGDIAQHAPH